MTLIVCIDDKNGMLFNCRRQSRDRILIEDLLRMTAGAPLYIAPYSVPLFPKDCTAYTVKDDPLADADGNGFCFIETKDPAPYAEKIDTVVLYRWNRHYPADLYFTLDMTKFMHTETFEFAGSSHERITKEIYQCK